MYFKLSENTHYPINWHTMTPTGNQKSTYKSRSAWLIFSLLGRNRTLKGNGGLQGVRHCKGVDGSNANLIAESTHLMSSNVIALSTHSISNAQRSAVATQKPVSSAKYRPGQTLGYIGRISNYLEIVLNTHRRPYPNTTEGSGRSFCGCARKRSGLYTSGESHILGSRSMNLEVARFVSVNRLRI